MTDGVQQIRFDGRIPLPDGTASQFSVAGSFREADPTNLELEIFWHGYESNRRAGVAALMANRTNHLWILNDHTADGHVELLGLSGTSVNYSEKNPVSTRLDFAALQKGLHQEPEIRDCEFHVNVCLVPSGLFQNKIFERSYTGETKVTPLDSYTPIHVRTKYGELLVSETYAYESTEEFGNPVSKQVQKFTITGDISVPKGVSLYEVNEEYKAEIDIIRRALGLCFRQSVRYVQISYIDKNEPGRRTPFYRRRLSEPVKRLRNDPFIEARNLGNGGLQRLVDAIRTVPQSADLIRAMDFLAESYTSTLENAFFMAFSAMETVVNIGAGADAEGIYSKSEWRAIRRELEAAITKITDELSLDASDLIEKLTELKRSPLKKRIQTACANHSPATGDLWPGLDFLAGIGNAAKIRNGLFHAAAYSDGGAIYESLIRVRTFTERLVAKLLKWPDENLWVWRDQDLKFLNVNTQSKESSAPGSS